MKTHILFLLLFLFVASAGAQTEIKLKTFATTFEQFDKIRNTDSSLWKLETNKLTFTKNDRVDSVLSSPFLDSLLWFMNRHSHTVVELVLKKDDWFTRKYRTTVSAQKQTQSILDYLVRRGINQSRLLANAIYCGPLLIADDTLGARPKTVQPKRTGIICCTLRVLSEDYRDPNTKK